MRKANFCMPLVEGRWSSASISATPIPVFEVITAAAFHLFASQAGFRKDGRVVVPDTSWPMVSDQLGDFQLKPALYTMARGRYADHIRAQLEAHGDAVVGVYVNSPHNPTGSLLTKADFEQIFAVLNAANSGAALEKRGGRKIGLVMDNPYPHAAAEILGVEISHETIFGVVGAMDHLGFVLEGLQRSDRSENFLIQHLGAVRHVRQHRRRVEEPRAVRALPMQVCTGIS